MNKLGAAMAVKGDADAPIAFFQNEYLHRSPVRIYPHVSHNPIWQKFHIEWHKAERMPIRLSLHVGYQHRNNGEE
jgi:hypothetical protein